ncbi:hypothetical protein ACH4FA_03095 [Streptomyces sp. NPDC017966]|uniref:hypothetical protein n=1 Tax=Streptomyces sp. NPDC017966 TaxID=3365023 RepID=UPI00378AF6E3
MRRERLLRSTALAGSLVLTAVAVPASVAAAAPAQSRGRTADPQDAALAFDSGAYTTLTVTVDGRPVDVRWYKEVCYVANPVAAAAQQPGGPGGGTTTIPHTACGYQSMNVFVPESAFGDQRAPVYLAVNNGGWMASYIRASVTAGSSYGSSTSNVGAALKAGYVFVDVASRGRGLVGADGSSPGKAPAAGTPRSPSRSTSTGRSPPTSRSRTSTTGSPGTSRTPATSTCSRPWPGSPRPSARPATR